MTEKWPMPGDFAQAVRAGASNSGPMDERLLAVLDAYGSEGGDAGFAIPAYARRTIMAMCGIEVIDEVASSTTSKPFKRKTVKFGDQLVFARDESIGCTFKFFGHAGSIVVTLNTQVPGHPIDVICRQKDVRHP